MNRSEAKILEDVFIGSGIFAGVDPDLDAKDIVGTYEELSLADAVERMTERIIRMLERWKSESWASDPLN